jgi:AcrR family transcriptional regulator
MAPVATRVKRGTGREALVAAARAELLARDGALEVTSVAERAGVSVGLLYRHFGSKAGLLTAIVEDFYARFDAAIAEAPGDTWAERERARTDLAVRFHYDNELAPLILARLVTDPEVAAAENRHLQAQVALGTRNVRNGQRSGEIPGDLDAGVAAALILGGVRQVLIEVLARPRRPRADRVSAQLWRLVVAAVRCKETP